MKIYFAGALFSMAEKVFNETLKNELLKLKPDLQILLPQDEAKKIFGDPDFENKVFQSCVEGVKEADLILCILDGPDADSGTCIELGLAYQQGKRIIGVRTDFRASEEDGLNIMVRKVLNEYINKTELHSVEELAELIAEYL